MTTLYPARRPSRLAVEWRDFNGAIRYRWFASGTPAPPAAPQGALWDWPAWVATGKGVINASATLAQAERTLRQLGHTIGEWDKEHG